MALQIIIQTIIEIHPPWTYLNYQSAACTSTY